MKNRNSKESNFFYSPKLIKTIEFAYPILYEQKHETTLMR